MVSTRGGGEQVEQCEMNVLSFLLLLLPVRFSVLVCVESVFNPHNKCKLFKYVFSELYVYLIVKGC